MRILIATGICEPEAGGPATYAPRLARKLFDAGHEVLLLTYSNQAAYDFDAEYPFPITRVVRTKNKLLNYFHYFRAILKLGRTDVVYALDWIAAGIPVALVSWLRGTPYLVRIGGDYAWEQKYLESSQSPIPLRDFYTSGLYRNYKAIAAIIAIVLGGACRVVFTSVTQRELYELYHGLSPRKTTTIFNPIPRLAWPEIMRTNATDEIVSVARLIAMKNLDTVIRAFAKAKLPDSYTLTIIGEGPRKERLQTLIEKLHLTDRVSLVPGTRQKELYERIKNCRSMVVSSLTDISSNHVCEALALGIPILVTSENYLPMRDQLPHMLDPRSEEDFIEGFEMLADPPRYRSFCDALKEVRYTHDWDDVLTQHLTLFEDCMENPKP